MKKNRLKWLHFPKKTVRWVALFISLMAGITNLSAQTIALTGTVTDETGVGLPGVSVTILNTAKGTITDLDGKYSISANSENDILSFSYLGMKNQQIKVGSQKVINTTLAEDSHLIDEVVVVGYGSMKVKDLTSSITTVKADEITKTPNGQAMQALQGKVAGLQVVSNGAPGSSPTVRVRGVGSYPVENETNENPLYVVDGIFYENIDFLNPTDIASMSILKDASASAIYGVRAANGVVLIETKSGGYNKKTEVTFDGYYGTQIAQNVLKMANSEQYTTMMMESGSSAQIASIENAMQRYGRSRENPNVPLPNTDWYDEILRQAQVQNYSVNISGGGQKAAYSIGTNYFGQEGIMDMKSEYSRFNLRSKLDFKATDWLTVGGNVIWSQATKYDEEKTGWSLAYYAIPIMPVYDDLNTDASPVKYSNAKDLGYRSMQNPRPIMDNSDKRRLNKKLMTNFYATFDLLPKKLTFKTSYNNAYTNNEERDVLFPYNAGNGDSRNNSEIIMKMKNYLDVTWDNVLTYTDTFGKHNLTAMGGTSFRNESYTLLEAKGVNFPTKLEQSWYIDQAQELPTTNGTDRTLKHDGLHEYGMSYFGRLSYNYDNKYLLYGTMRADGSSKYQEKWGYFPTIGAGWVMSEEGFMKDIEAINHLKLRASWGELGNDKIKASDGSYTTKPAIAIIDGNLVGGTSLSGLYSELSWEVTEETNVGFSSTLLNNRLDIEADYYIRDTKNAGIDVYPPYTHDHVLRNVGVIRNSGFEFAVNWSDKITDDLRYNIGLNMSTLKNEVRDLFGQPYLDGYNDRRSMVGESVLAFFGREIAGVYQNQAEIDNDPIAQAAIADKVDIRPGYFKYKDQNNDKKINDDDRVILGSYLPSYMYGGNIGLSYKNIDFSATFMGQSGNKIYNAKRAVYRNTTDQNMDANLAINRWHGEGTTNKYPSSAALLDVSGWNVKMNDYLVEDGSFFRIQNVQLAYNILKKNWFGTQLPDMRISFTADRPLTLFSYNGFNPEVFDGVDNETYAIPATYTIGLNIKF